MKDRAAPANRERAPDSPDAGRTVRRLEQGIVLDASVGVKFVVAEEGHESARALLVAADGTAAQHDAPPGKVSMTAALARAAIVGHAVAATCRHPRHSRD